MPKLRKVPLRICVGCQEKQSKKEMVRVVRTPQGEVVLDPTGKRSGRGAYLCLKSDCLKKALKGKRFEKNLQQPVSDQVIAEITGLLQESANSQA